MITSKSDRDRIRQRSAEKRGQGMARTKAAKLNAKRGRPRKDGAREPNGRHSRSGIESEAAERVAIAARMRHLGLSDEQAKDQKAGSFIGILNMRGPVDGLSDAQYDAAVNFLNLHLAMQRTVQSPGALYDPEARGGSGSDPDAYADWVKRISDRYNAARAAIQEAQFCNRTENLLGAVDHIIIRGEHWEHLTGATRIACNALSRHFRLVDGSRKAA